MIELTGLLCIAINRTRVELKHIVVSRNRIVKCDYQSNQSGIETAINEISELLMKHYQSNQSGIETLLT